MTEDGRTIADGLDSEQGDLIVEEGFTPEGRAYLTGMLSGILATIRTFSVTDSGFDESDIEEIQRIANGREAELLSAVEDADTKTPLTRRLTSSHLWSDRSSVPEKYVLHGG